MYIGKLAQLFGVSTKTIRHYEQIGLLPPAARQGSYRVHRQQHQAAILACLADNPACPPPLS